MLSDEMHRLTWFIAAGSRLTVSRAQEPSHVVGEGAHGLHSFGIEGGFAFHAAKSDVPILGGDDRHIQDMEGHVERLESGSRTATAADGNSSCRFAGDIGTVGIERSLHHGKECSVRLSVIDRRGDDYTVGIGEFGTYLIANIIVKDAMTEGFVLALHTGYTSPDGLVADPYRLGFDSVFGQLLGHFGQGDRGITLFARAAVD